MFTLPFLIQRIRDQDGDSFGGLGSGLSLGLDQYREPALFAALVVGAIFSAAYEIGFVAWKGGTPGKLAVGLRVVSVDGASPPGFERAAFRWSPALIGYLPFVAWLTQILSLVWIFSDSRRRSLHDRVGRTYVVKR